MVRAIRYEDEFLMKLKEKDILFLHTEVVNLLFGIMPK